MIVLRNGNGKFILAPTDVVKERLKEMENGGKE